MSIRHMQTIGHGIGHPLVHTLKPLLTTGQVGIHHVTAATLA